ncbi:MAG TPA: hypothetical protein VFY13_03095 [Luteolibacter sp.]|nr:hypothetical protein [Luteolibacter sp.]
MDVVDWVDCQARADQRTRHCNPPPILIQLMNYSQYAGSEEFRMLTRTEFFVEKGPPGSAFFVEEE